MAKTMDIKTNKSQKNTVDGLCEEAQNADPMQVPMVKLHADKTIYNLRVIKCGTPKSSAKQKMSDHDVLNT